MEDIFPGGPPDSFLLDKMLFSDIHEQKEMLIYFFPQKTLKDIDVFSPLRKPLGCWGKGDF
jgi:hypothetical protein